MNRRNRKLQKAKLTSDNLFQVYLLSHKKLVYWTSIFYFIVLIDFLVLSSIAQYKDYILYKDLNRKREFVNELIRTHNISHSNRIRKFNFSTIEAREESEIFRNWPRERGDIQNTISNIRKLYPLLIQENLLAETEVYLARIDSLFKFYDQQITALINSSIQKSIDEDKIRTLISEYTRTINDLLAIISQSNLAHIADVELRKYFSEADFEKSLSEILRDTDLPLDLLESKLNTSFVNIPTVNIPVSNKITLLFTFIALYLLSLFLPLLHNNYYHLETLIKTKSNIHNFVPSLRNILIRFSNQNETMDKTTYIIGLLIVRIFPIGLTGVIGAFHYFAYSKLFVSSLMIMYVIIITYTNIKCFRIIR